MKTTTLTIFLKHDELCFFEEMMLVISEILNITPLPHKDIIDHGKGMYTAQRWENVYETISAANDTLAVGLLVNDHEQKKIYSFLSFFTARKGLKLNKS